MTSSPAATSVVIDSNVWISALVFGGRPREVLEMVVEQGYRVVLSAEIVSEVRRTLQRKFPDFVADFEALLVALERSIDTVSLGGKTVNICRDPDDDRVIETALIGRADSIVSGDNDLLSLERHESVTIMRPDAWLASR